MISGIVAIALCGLVAGNMVVSAAHLWILAERAPIPTAARAGALALLMALFPLFVLTWKVAADAS